MLRDNGTLVLNYVGDTSCIFMYTVELQLSGLIGTTSHPDMQKIRTVGFFFANRPHW
jgi:hypothetical protein